MLAVKTESRTEGTRGTLGCCPLLDLQIQFYCETTSISPEATGRPGPTAGPTSIKDELRRICGLGGSKTDQIPVWTGTELLWSVLQVCVPVVSVQLVKKHKTAGLVPNGLAITMDTGQKVRLATR